MFPCSPVIVFNEKYVIVGGGVMFLPPSLKFTYTVVSAVILTVAVTSPVCPPFKISPPEIDHISTPYPLSASAVNEITVSLGTVLSAEIEGFADICPCSP